jgi:ABC-type multidrug transport system ATPase subunit
MTLLLGPPACGKSTLLKLLAGRLTGSSAAGLDMSGEVRYNGQAPDTFDVVRTCAFVNQVCSLLYLISSVVQAALAATGSNAALPFLASRHRLSWDS